MTVRGRRGRERGREGEREGGREGEREGEREGGRRCEKLIEDLVCWLCQAEAQVASLLPSVWNQSGSVGVLSSEELADSF